MYLGVDGTTPERRGLFLRSCPPSDEDGNTSIDNSVKSNRLVLQSAPTRYVPSMPGRRVGAPACHDGKLLVRRDGSRVSTFAAPSGRTGATGCNKDRVIHLLSHA